MVQCAHHLIVGVLIPSNGTNPVMLALVVNSVA